MFKLLAAGAAAAALFIPLAPAAAAELTPTEQVWLQAALPVLAYAQKQGLPLDLVVQPQDTPGHTPLGMAYIDGRCKLVLSMRGNPEAQATLDRIAPDLVGPVVEAIAAHELGHCWRHVSGTWGRLPAQLAESPPPAQLTAEQAALLRDMWRTRREEGYADLVGLAWTLQHHPARYAEVHAWHVRLRAEQEIETGPHDTRAWVRLAQDPHQFGRDALLFERVQALWQTGLVAGSRLARATHQGEAGTTTLADNSAPAR
jgi:hypothetical protein